MYIYIYYMYVCMYVCMYVNEKFQSNCLYFVEINKYILQFVFLIVFTFLEVL